MENAIPLENGLKYWGARSGSISKTGEFVFLIKRGGGAHQEHRGPSGWKLKRAPRHYHNKKFVRKGISMSAPVRKGVKQLVY